MKLRSAVPAVLACLLSGCILSVEPFHLPSDLRAEPAASGVYVEAGESRKEYVFTGGSGGTYALVTRDPATGEARSYAVSFFELGGRRMAELSSEQRDWDGLLVPARMLFRAEAGEGTLSFAPIDRKWLKERKVGLKLLPDEALLLTAPTSELRKLLEKHAAGSEMWDQEGVLRLVRRGS